MPTGSTSTGARATTAARRRSTASEIAAVRIGRTDDERIDGRVALVVELRDGGVVSFTGFQTLGTLHELAERLEAIAAADGA